MNYCSDIRLQNTADFVSDFSAHATRAADFVIREDCCQNCGPALRGQTSQFLCVLTL